MARSKLASGWGLCSATRPGGPGLWLTPPCRDRLLALPPLLLSSGVVVVGAGR